MMQGQPGNNVVPINNNPAREVPKPAGSLAKFRNFLVQPANEATFNQTESANDSDFSTKNLGHAPRGDEVLSAPNALDKKYDTSLAEDVEIKATSNEMRTSGEYPGVVVGEPVQVKETTGEHPGVLVGDPVQIRETVGEHPNVAVEDPAQTREAKYEEWAQEQLASGHLTAEGVATLTKELELRKKGVGLAPSQEEQKPPEGDKVLDVAPSVTDPERAKEALARLDKVKSNRPGFFKGLGEKMGLTKERLESVVGKVGKALDAYNNLEPKTKLAIGLSLAAVGMIGTAGGAPLVASAVGALRLATKVASTKAMYDGLAGMLDKKYEELDDVSGLRKKVMKAGALSAALLVNFAGANALTNTLDATGAFDKIKSAGDWTAKTFNSLHSGPTSNEGWDETRTNYSNEGRNAPRPDENYSNEARDAMRLNENYSNEGRDAPRPDENYSNEARDAMRLNENYSNEGRDAPRPDENYSNEGKTGVRPDSAEVVPTLEKPVSSAPLVMAESTPNLSANSYNPAYGFDPSSAPPVGSVEIYDQEGNTVWKLPDGTMMSADGTIFTNPSDVATMEGVNHSAPESSPVSVGGVNAIELDALRTEPLTEVAATPAMATEQVITATDGTPVVDGQGMGVTTSSVPGVDAVNPPTVQNLEATKPLDGGSNYSPLDEAKPYTPDSSQTVVQHSPSVTPLEPTRLSFNAGASLSLEDGSRLSALNTLTHVPSFDAAVMSAAQDIDKARSFISFGDNAPRIKDSFISVLQNNPSVTVENLMSTDPSSLPSRNGATLLEAQGVLKRILPEGALANESVAKATVIDVLQNNFTA